MSAEFGIFADLVPQKKSNDDQFNPFGDFGDLVPGVGIEQHMVGEFERFQAEDSDNTAFGDFSDLVPGADAQAIDAPADPLADRIFPEASALPEPGFFERVAGGFKSHDSLTQNLLDLLSDQIPEVDTVTGEFKTPEQQRVERVKLEEFERDRLAIPPADGFSDLTADFIGTAGAEIADPIAVATAPIGGSATGLARILKLAGVGGAFEGAAGTAEQFADKGEIVDGGAIAQRAAIGAVAAPAIDQVFRLAGAGVRKLLDLRNKPGADAASLDSSIDQLTDETLRVAQAAGFTAEEAAEGLAAAVRVTTTDQGEVVVPDSSILDSLPGIEPPPANTQNSLADDVVEPVVSVDESVTPTVGAESIDLPNVPLVENTSLIQSEPPLGEAIDGSVSLVPQSNLAQADELSRMAELTSDIDTKNKLLSLADEFRARESSEVKVIEPTNLDGNNIGADANEIPFPNSGGPTPPETTFYSNPFGVAAKEIARDLALNPGRNLASGFAGGTVGATTSDNEMGSPGWWADVSKGAATGFAISQFGRATRLFGEGSILDDARQRSGKWIESLPLIGRGPTEVREIKRKQRLMRQVIDKQTDEVGKFLVKNFTPSERGQMADLIENRGIVREMNLIHKQADVLDNYLTEVGQRMKDLGMLSEEQELGGYLHRYYSKYLKNDSDFVSAKRQTLNGSYTIERGTDESFSSQYFSPRAQGILDQVQQLNTDIRKLENVSENIFSNDDLARLKDLKQQRQALNKLDLREYTADENGNVKSFFFLSDELPRLERGDGSILGLKGGPGPGLDPTLGPQPGNIKDFGETDRTWSIRGVRDGNAVLHRDWTDAERQSWGEIKDAGYRYVRGMAEVSHDMSLATMYKELSRNTDWVSDKPINGWKEVPTANVKGSRLKRYGALAGKYVRPDVWNGVNRYGRNLRIFGGIGEKNIPGTGVTVENAYRHLLNKWKLYKTVYNPVSHVNNTFSNFEMLYMAGYSPKDFFVGVNEIRKGDKSDLVREANENGLFGADWSSSITSNQEDRNLTDLANEMLNQSEIPDAILSTRVMMDIKEWFINSKNSIADADSKFGSGVELAKTMAKPGVLGLKTAFKPVDVAARAAQKAYRMEDEVFKLSVYQAERRNGASPEQAVQAAQQFFFDYNDLPDAVKAARDFPVGSPFISYTYLAIPAIARNITQNPEKVLALAAAVEAMNYSATVLDGGEPGEYWTRSEHEDTASAPWDKGRAIWGARNIVNIPDVPGLPSLDSYRLSIARMHALGNPFMAESGERKFSVPGIASFWGSDIFGSNPAHAMLDLVANEDWKGKPIWKEGAPPEERAKLAANYLYQAWAPSNPLIPGGYHQQKILEGFAADKVNAENAGEQPGLISSVVEGANEVSEFLGMQGFTGVDKLGNEVRSRDALLGSVGVKLRPTNFQQSLDFSSSGLENDLNKLSEWFRGEQKKFAEGRISQAQLDKQFAKFERERAELEKDNIANQKARDFLLPQ